MLTLSFKRKCGDIVYVVRHWSAKPVKVVQVHLSPLHFFKKSVTKNVCNAYFHYVSSVSSAVEFRANNAAVTGSNPVRSSLGNSSSGRILCLEHGGPGSIPGFPINFSCKKSFIKRTKNKDLLV